MLADTRLFCLNGIFDNDRLYLQYSDICGTIRTRESISLLDDFEMVAAILIGIACCTPEQLGALPAQFVPPQSAEMSQQWPLKDLIGYNLMIPVLHGEPEAVTFEKLLSTDDLELGSRSSKYAILPRTDISGDDLMVKISYELDSRPKEGDLIAMGREAGIDYLPTIASTYDIWRTSDGLRHAFETLAEVKYERRILRATIYRRYLPLYSLLLTRSPGIVASLVDQILDCKSTTKNFRAC